VPKIVDHEAQRAELRSAARAVFAERGVTRTGLVHVAERAGMGRASVYHYYPDKEALVADVTRELLAEETRLFERASSAAGSALERIVAVASTVTELYELWGDHGGVILESWCRDLETLRPALAAIRADLAAMIREGQRAGEIAAELSAESTAAMIVALIDGLLMQHFVDPRAIGARRRLGRDVAACVRRMLVP
jgi:AcrR family transcriptional regulator